MMLSQTINPPTVSLRVANSADTSRLEQIVHLAYRGGISTVSWKNEDYLVKGPRIAAPELQALIVSETATILVAEITKEVTDLVGCVLVENHGADAHIGLLAVSPDCQNLGLGKLLVKAAEDYAYSQFRCCSAKMFVLSGRDELLGWYKRLGYLETGETTPFPVPETGLKALQNNAHFIVISKNIQTE